MTTETAIAIPDAELKSLGTTGIATYATDISSLAFQSPRLRFTRDEIMSIAERCPEGTTAQELKTFVTLAMLRGAHPLLNQMYIVKYKKKDGGYYPAAFITSYLWFDQEARKALPGLVHTLPLWFEVETGKWHEIWPFDPKDKAPYAGKMGFKTPDMPDYEWVSLRWDERFKLTPWGKPQGEWANQPIHQMDKCLLKKIDDRLVPSYLQGVETELDHQPPLEAQGYIVDPEKNGLENAKAAAETRQEKNAEMKRLRSGDLAGPATEDQKAEFIDLKGRVDQEWLIKTMNKLFGHASVKKLGGAGYETLLIEMRGEAKPEPEDDPGESSPD